MKAKKHPPRRSACPVNASLEAFGDRWSLLIVRDLMFKGRCRYNEFLGAEESVATNVLADRLRRLEAEGIVEGHDDPADARKRVYRLTPKGIDLAPLLVELIVWGARYYRTDAPPEVVAQMEDERGAFLADLRQKLREAGVSGHT